MTTVITPEQIQQAELQKQTPTLPENPKASAVFKDGVPPQVTALDTASSPVRTKLNTLRGLQAMNPTEARAREMIDLERQRGRIARFALLQKSATPEQKEILKDKDVVEKLRASDILLLKKKGVDLANLLLVPVGVDPTKSTNRDFIEKGEHKNFIVNFGENKNGKNDIDNIVGAGDILPLSISQVKIVSEKYPNGIIADRRSTPRPGYYNDTCKPPYIAVHDGDRIEVLKIGAVDEKALKEANESEEKWLRDRRIEDMIDNGGKALSELPEDKKLEAEAQKEIEEMKKRREKYKNYNPENKKKFLETFGEVLDRETSKYKIPKDMLVNNLFEKENRSFDPFIKNPASSAHGLGQIIDGTWKSISYRLGRRLDRMNPEDQIVATCEYLSYIKSLRDCSWGEAIVYYHAGENFNDSNVRTAMAVNSPIASRMQNPENPTAKDYVNAAAKYYGVTEYMSA